MRPNQENKVKLVAEIKEKLQNANSVLFVDYSGLKVSEDTELRKTFRENGVESKVYKNRLMLRALEEAGFTGFDPKAFEGTTAVAFSTDEVAPARVFCQKQKAFNKMDVKFGYVNGELFGKEQIVSLSKIPSKEVLIAMLLGTLNAPVSALARALNAIAEKQEQ